MDAPYGQEFGLIEWSSGVGWEFNWLSALVVALLLGHAFHRHHLKKRRRRSLTRNEDGSYLWIEIDGSPASSRDDPRDRWDAEDAADNDGDGDGD
jgi:hypothetical protein